jgi:hypothetical protein
MNHKALFLDEYLNELGTKNFDSTDEFITFKNGTFNIRLDAFLYRSKDILYYAYIYPTDEKLLIDVKIEPIKNIKNKDNPYSSRLIRIKERIEKGDLKLIVGESIIGQLARMAVLGLKNNWILIIVIGLVCAVAGGGVAYSIGLNNGITQGFNQAQHIINSTVNNIIPTPTPVLVHP